jgi:hypothetical protein
VADESGRLLEGKVRRQALIAADPSYVAKMVALRAGECNRCGACCRMLFDCPFYVAGTGCSAYDRRSEVCRVFPIDQRDLDDVAAYGGECSYSFPASMGANNANPLDRTVAAPINEAIVDRFTLAHLGVGAAAGAMRLPLWWVVVGSLMFEIMENLLQPKFLSIFPNTADRDSPMNSSADTLAVILGWWVASGGKGR